MTNSQIKELADYLQDLTEGLYEWDYDKLAMQTEFPILYQKIELLMKETFKQKTKRKRFC